MRLVDTLIGAKAYGRGMHQPALNLGKGGVFGWSPNLNSLVSNQAYVRRNLIPVVLELPRFIQLMPEPEVWAESMRQLFEVHPRVIEGLNAGLTVEFDEHPVGGGGEMQQEFTDVKRARSEPSFGWVEKYGMPIQTLLHYWIQYGMMDPETKYALISTIEGNRPEDMLHDWYTMSMLFIEPDPTHTRVVKSWVSTNMAPMNTGEIVGKRELAAASEVLNLTIPFTAVSQFSLGTSVFAQSVLDNISILRANPYNRQAMIDKIAADVAAAGTAGYHAGIQDLQGRLVNGIDS